MGQIPRSTERISSWFVCYWCSELVCWLHVRTLYTDICGNREFLHEAQDVLRFSTGNLYLNDKSTGSVVCQQPFGGARKSGQKKRSHLFLFFLLALLLLASASDVWNLLHLNYHSYSSRATFLTQRRGVYEINVSITGCAVAQALC